MFNLVAVWGILYSFCIVSTLMTRKGRQDLRLEQSAPPQQRSWLRLWLNCTWNQTSSNVCLSVLQSN